MPVAPNANGHWRHHPESEQVGVTEHAILLIDDDAELGALMAEYFSAHGYRIELAVDGREGLSRALTGRHNLVILDVMLPMLDGFEVLRQLRGRSELPVIMLTARTGQTDRIAALEAGADDYLPKPFAPGELLARVRAILRRAGHAMPVRQAAIRVGDILVNPGTRKVLLRGDPVELTAIEFDILTLLIRSAGRAVSRDEIATALYQRATTPYDRAIDVHVSHLRKKLERPNRPLIRTIRGVGYLFQAEP